VSVPPLGKDRSGRACGLWNVSDCSLPVAALRLWQRTTEGEFYGELSTPAPIGGQWPYVRAVSGATRGACIGRQAAGQETACTPCRIVELLTGRLPGEEEWTCYQPHAGFDRAAV
jgi:hypothetical protein